MNTACINTPIGWVIIWGSAFGVHKVSILKKGDDKSVASGPVADAAIQLQEYFKGHRESFDLLLSPIGTEFQKSVWEKMSQIPLGETRSYGDVARSLGKKGAARAVGAACGKNPLLIFQPCHRVVASDGGLGGFAAGLKVKEKLLLWEMQLSRGQVCAHGPELVSQKE